MLFLISMHAGWEQHGRLLCQRLALPFEEYWPCLGVCADLSSLPGLALLEMHFADNNRRFVLGKKASLA